MTRYEKRNILQNLTENTNKRDNWEVKKSLMIIRKTRSKVERLWAGRYTGETTERLNIHKRGALTGN